MHRRAFFRRHPSETTTFDATNPPRPRRNTRWIAIERDFDVHGSAATGRITPAESETPWTPMSSFFAGASRACFPEHHLIARSSPHDRGIRQ